VRQRLLEFVAAHPDLLVLTGAGLSTASGIGDYRDEGGAWKRRPPVELREFLESDHARRRYWSRSLFGWPHFAAAQPNVGHTALARLDRAGRLIGTITQNVDGLHSRAGHDDVVELHGRLADVRCLQCGAMYSRADVQTRLVAANPDFAARVVEQRADGDAELTDEDLGRFRVVEQRADGDAELTDEDLGRFRVVDCWTCGGLLKPGVVFFGESVPRAVVEHALGLLDRASALLLIGTSVMVYSGYRFCRVAAAQRKPIAAINRGVTRADALLQLKVEDDCAAVLAQLIDSMDLCFDS
jgi:NAD-dependent SIR2 family protein deacetylase